MTENRCVICGAIVPEGTQVCPICEDAYLKVREYIDTVKAKYKEVEEKEKGNERDFI